MTRVIVYEYRGLPTRVMYHRDDEAHGELRNDIISYLVSHRVSSWYPVMSLLEKQSFVSPAPPTCRQIPRKDLETHIILG